MGIAQMFCSIMSVLTRGYKHFPESGKMFTSTARLEQDRIPAVKSFVPQIMCKNPQITLMEKKNARSGILDHHTSAQIQDLLLPTLKNYWVAEQQIPCRIDPEHLYFSFLIDPEHLYFSLLHHANMCIVALNVGWDDGNTLLLWH